jgi:hypothetical protein
MSGAWTQRQDAGPGAGAEPVHVDEHVDRPVADRFGAARSGSV